ncbi:MAG TPA: ATP-binding protein, partial [bacterium]|nr:ATP-binding protein [bacterium]
SSGALKDETAGPRFVDVIARNATRLAALVQDLLDLSRLESREGPETLKSVDPADALARAAAPYRETAAAKRIQLVVEETQAPPVRGEPGLLERALTNLVLNAVRYTPEGGRVVLRAREVTGSAEGRRAVRFEVEDTGIGIPRGALPRIFERFYRVDPARSRELGGTGLGLSIVKHAVDAMGGQVSVDSAVGHGSTFSVTLDAWDEARTRGTE